jgi:hypothetical protein
MDARVKLEHDGGEGVAWASSCDAFFPSIGEIFAFVTDIRKRYGNTGAAS